MKLIIVSAAPHAMALGSWWALSHSAPSIVFVFKPEEVGSTRYHPMETIIMSKSVRTMKGIALPLIAILAVAACSSDLVEPRVEVSFQVESVGAENPIFVMTQTGVPAHVMEALFEGQVVADGAGCLRLGDAEGPTVVWPANFTGVVTTEGVAIRDEGGNEVGQVGGSFSFGGGEISGLLESLGFTQADRDLAEELCPGRYWIVAP